MSEKKAPNRIPAADAEAWQSWAMPAIDDDGKVINAHQKHQKQDVEQEESIEDVEVEELPQGGLTADELEAIVREAELEGFAKGREEGFKKGYDDGFESGQHKGSLEMRQQLVAEQQTFQGLAEALFNPIGEQDERLETLILETICRLSRAVVQRELTTQPNDIVKLVKSAVQALPAGRDHLTVYLNPQDADQIEQYAQEHNLDWTFHADAELAAGGAKVVTRDSVVDCSLERRLEEVIDRFLSQQEVDEQTSDEQLFAARGAADESRTEAVDTETSAPVDSEQAFDANEQDSLP
ncbi:flagellar assembly protein FliH [Gilvimarinus chinensis]|uniref:flagellar assembly protein FliH n=1 Tax=Gilvimarinus chinensis TaxID=396005 RepID=UPI00037E205B|nr:flagellar assembly protein FliH [Gilvimarinus chinensis]